ncbi:MAG: SHOCT domain-containing protein [Sulfuriferula sp.]
MWNQMMNNGSGWMGVGMALFGVLVVSGIVILVKALLSAAAPSVTSPENGSDLLKARYARGEIGAEEFAQKKHDLKQ